MWDVNYGKEQRLSFHLSIYPIFLDKNSQSYRCLHFNPFFHTKHVILTGFSRKYADVITFFRFFQLFIKFHVILHIHTQNYAHCAFCSRNNRGGQTCPPPPQDGGCQVPPPKIGLNKGFFVNHMISWVTAFLLTRVIRVINSYTQKKEKIIATQLIAASDKMLWPPTRHLFS